MKGRQISYIRGIVAEYWVCLYFWVRGYRILERRYKTKVGEIDFIAKRGSLIVFVEVKYRGHALEDGLYAVTARAQRRITQAAQLYLQAQRDAGHSDLRFDVVCVIPPFWIKHVRNAWQV